MRSRLRGRRPIADPARFLWLPGWSAGPAVWRNAIRDAPDGEHAVRDLGAVTSAAEIPAAAQAALEELPGPAIVVGWSLGAMVALGLARDVPERVQGLLLVGATGRFVDEQGEAGWPAETLRRMSARLDEDAPGVLAAFDRRMFARAERRAGEDARWAAARDGAAVSVPALRAGLAFLEEFSVDPAAVRVPVALLHGSEDAICPPAAAERLAAGLPDARLTVVDGAGHAPFWTAPERFGDWLRDAAA